jgi:uncharacterized membrane protein YtjA (UPF0391 family)
MLFWTPMLYWAALFFVIAMVAAFLGFGGVSSDAAVVARVLFVVFLVCAAVSLLFGLFRGGRRGHV